MATIIPYKGKFPKIANDAFIAQNAVIIGDVVIGSKSSIWYNCVIRGDVNHIRIGQETNIQDGTIIHVGTNNGPTIIGDGITIGHKALIHACTLHDYSFIGMNSTVMDYAQIKSYSMVAAGALVTNNKIVEENELWTGVPAKFLRKLKKEEVDYINVSKDRYINLAKEYMY
ncbi:MAG: gamma carbonic anhydrase family protein [Candidatus Midichloriaceae bacterium]